MRVPSTPNWTPIDPPRRREGRTSVRWSKFTSAGQSTCEAWTSRLWSEASPAGFQKIALGSSATATNVPPMPCARAPTPMRRKVADDVPSRWLPNPPWARAEPCAIVSATSVSARAQPQMALEVHIELEPPGCAAAVVRRIVDDSGLHVIVQAVDVIGIERALAPYVALPRDRIDAVDHLGPEDVVALQAQIAAAIEHRKSIVQLEIGHDLEWGVLRIGQPDRVLVGDVVRGVGPTGLALQVEVQPPTPEPFPAVRRAVVEAQVEVGGDLVRTVPVHEHLGQARQRAPADFLDGLVLGRIAALALRLLVRVRQLARPVVRRSLLELHLEPFRAGEVSVEVDEIRR